MSGGVIGAGIGKGGNDMERKDMRCKNCYYWERIPGRVENSAAVGRCRYSLPTITADGKTVSKWPLVYDNDWCKFFFPLPEDEREESGEEEGGEEDNVVVDAPPPPSKQCVTCAHWEWIDIYPYNKGECRLPGPQIRDGLDGSFAWPETKKYHWCSKHILK